MPGVLVSIVFVCVLSLGLASASYAMGLILKDEDSFAPFVQGISLPLLLLSGVFLPMTLAPAWLEKLSQLNPLTYVLDGTRALFAGDWGDAAIRWGIISSVGIAIVLTWWSARRFQRLSS